VGRYKANLEALYIPIFIDRVIEIHGQLYSYEVQEACENTANVVPLSELYDRINSVQNNLRSR